MLTQDGCSRRRRRLWEALPSTCDVLIVGDPQHLVYFANYVQSPFTFRAAEARALLVMTPDRATLVADNLTEPYWSRAHVDEVVAPTWYSGQTSAPYRQGQLVRTALEVLGRCPGTRLGVELAAVPSGVVRGLAVSLGDVDVVDLGPIIRPLRRVKDADEIELIRRSIRAGEAGHAAALEGIAPGMTELDAYALVQEAAVRALGAPAIVYGDFASGPRCATDRGGPPTSRVIEKGDLFLLDYSVVADGYRGDFTNTFLVDGTPSARQREFFDACVGAMEAGEAVLRPGTPALDVDAAVRGHFASLGLDAYFLSHSGHGLGLGHPEPPYLVPEAAETLVEGDVIALEPGLYLEGVGGMRFENNYLITSGGFERLTNHRITLQP